MFNIHSFLFSIILLLNVILLVTSITCSDQLDCQQNIYTKVESIANSDNLPTIQIDVKNIRDNGFSMLDSLDSISKKIPVATTSVGTWNAAIFTVTKFLTETKGSWGIHCIKETCTEVCIYSYRTAGSERITTQGARNIPKQIADALVLLDYAKYRARCCDGDFHVDANGDIQC